MTKSKENAYVRGGLIQARVDNEEMQEIITKAQMFSRGNVSEFVRMAVLNYKPLKRVKVGR